MSREREKFRTFYAQDYPSMCRWIDEPPGVDCECGGDMFLHHNGVTYICSECGKCRQKRGYNDK